MSAYAWDGGFVLATIFLFAACALLVRGCERI